MSPDIPLGLQWLGGMCENGNDIAALLVISGSLRREVQCPQAPREVRHVHGTNDTVMDFPLWRDKFDCGVGQDAGAWNVVDFLTFQRTTWEDCGSGQKFRFLIVAQR